MVGTSSQSVPESWPLMLGGFLTWLEHFWWAHTWVVGISPAGYVDVCCGLQIGICFDSATTLQQEFFTYSDQQNYRKNQPEIFWLQLWWNNLRSHQPHMGSGRTIHHPNEWFHVGKTHLLESLDGFVASRFQKFQIHPVFWMKFLSPITDPIFFLASKHTDVFFRFHPQNLGIFHQKWGFGGCPTDPNWSAKMEVFHRSFMLDSWVSKQQKPGSLSKENYGIKTRPGKRTFT